MYILLLYDVIADKFRHRRHQRHHDVPAHNGNGVILIFRQPPGRCRDLECAGIHVPIVPARAPRQRGAALGSACDEALRQAMMTAPGRSIFTVEPTSHQQNGQIYGIRVSCQRDEMITARTAFGGKPVFHG